MHPAGKFRQKIKNMHAKQAEEQAARDEIERQNAEAEAQRVALQLKLDDQVGRCICRKIRILCRSAPVLHNLQFIYTLQVREEEQAKRKKKEERLRKASEKKENAATAKK